MKTESINIPTTQNLQLAAQLKTPSNTLKGAILICRAMGVNQYYYSHFADFFVENGYAVLTFDYRGTGKSAPNRLRGFKATLADWGEDMTQAFEWLKTKFPNVKKIFIGHSIGSQLMGLMSNNQDIDQVVFLASSTGYWKEEPSPIRYKHLFLLAVVIPFSVAIWGFVNAKAFGQGRNYPKGIGLQWRKWCLNPKYLGMDLGTKLNQEHYESFTGNIYSIWFSDDPIANQTSAKRLLTFYPNASKTLEMVIPQSIGATHIGHMGFLSRKSTTHLWKKVLRIFDK